MKDVQRDTDIKVQEPNSEDCVDFTFSGTSCERVAFVFDKKFITSAIKKFMLDMSSPGSFQNTVNSLSMDTSLRRALL